ncbi:ferritin-like domain-containing protein [Nocardia implantans]|uniref:Ferritin-like domain-containing protein n=1 Tax=Nocardia implantans TaxID=3108168 RepID=A0ABU6ANC2_9NOCA|nr:MULTISPECIES: ferritin-like domain-containing protein [unclassified Nocardia]MBF6192111.1 ferritin [Nocardia beijingensis]MEA3530243.1 ferritin-like domain-containing protein [Nocardia sp. CDC192]MEB3508951.1 ferritin-like domain-containing protein [Nocardia sp. CDC186]
MPDIDDADESFPDLLRTQIRREFTTAQQYLAAAVYFDTRRLPQLAGHAYDLSREHHGNALRMVQYLLDRDLPVQIGGLDEIHSTFESPRAAVAALLEIEQARRAGISELARTARASGDYLGERFIQWFLAEQVKNVAGMSTLLAVLDRADGQLFDVEEFVAREMRSRPRADIPAPKMAGAAKN